MEPQLPIVLYDDCCYVRYMDYRALQEQRDLLKHYLRVATWHTMDDQTVGCGLCQAATAPTWNEIRHCDGCPLHE